MRARSRRSAGIRRCLPLVLLAALAGCGVTRPTGGPKTWHLFFPQDHLDEHVLEVTSLAPGNPAPIQGFVPATGDPWLRDLTDRSFDNHVVLKAAVAEDQVALARSGDTVTVVGTASMDGSGGELDTATGRLEGLTWCFRPAIAARAVVFTASMAVDALSATGHNAEAFAGLSAWGDGGDCRSDERVAGGVTTDAPATCNHASVEVATDLAGDGTACVDGDTVGAGITWGVSAGTATGAGGGVASVKVTFTVEATAVP